VEEEGGGPEGANVDRSPERSDYSTNEGVDTVAEEAARAVYEAVRAIAAAADGGGVTAAEAARKKIVRFAADLQRSP
jgi:hypothetical protein